MDRLSHVVHSVDHDCFIVPRGSIKKIPLGELRSNEAFRGLKSNEAYDIANYVHLRPPHHKHIKELNARKEGVYNNDFLDNAGEDLPKDCWTIMPDTLGKTTCLRNKMWPGFYAYHVNN